MDAALIDVVLLCNIERHIDSRFRPSSLARVFAASTLARSEL